MINYSKYSVEDLLQDDYFVVSILSPTAETDRYWLYLIEHNLLDKDVFDQAKTFLLNPNATNEIHIDDRLEIIWNRVVETNSKRTIKKKFHVFWKVASIAASLVIVFVLIKNLNRDIDYHIADSSDYDFKKIEKIDISEKIEVVINDKRISLDSDEAIVSHNEEGVTINQDTLMASGEKSEIKYNQLTVPYGKRSSLKLIDGTTITVNAGTRVIYPEHFVGLKREIYVDGEIFADIAHDKKKPFIVNTSDLSVEVLGTKFNITAYENENDKSVVLVEGLVKVFHDKNKKEGSVIVPNQQLLLTSVGEKIQYVDVDNYISWVYGLYSFNNESFDTILSRVSRYYGVKIVSDTRGTESLTCSGRLDLKEELETVLNNLALTTELKYKYENDKYVFR